MPQFIITPWRNNNDLLQVRKELYENDSQMRRHGVDWISAWRMRGPLPHAIESTAAIVDAQLHHSSTSNSPFSIRATYAAAISRFVTGYCDITQTSAVRRSMYDVASEIGLPASFVELRHEATHSDLPSLQRLQRHSGLALKWLWDHYWMKLDKRSTGMIASAETSAKQPMSVDARSQLSSVIAQFVADRRKALRSNNISANSNVSVDAARDIICTTLGRSANLRLLVGELCREKGLVPAGRKAGDTMKGAFLLWDELLILLHSHQRRFLRLLLETFTTHVTHGIALSGFEDGIYKWTMHILTDPAWTSHVSESLTSKVIEDCMLHEPNGRQLAKAIAENAPSERGLLEKYGSIFE